MAKLPGYLRIVGTTFDPPNDFKIIVAFRWWHPGTWWILVRAAWAMLWGNLKQEESR